MTQKKDTSLVKEFQKVLLDLTFTGHRQKYKKKLTMIRIFFQSIYHFIECDFYYFFISEMNLSSKYNSK